MKELIDLTVWNNLIRHSEQGTIFCSDTWMRIFDRPFKIYGYYRGDSLMGGIAGFGDGDAFLSGATPFTPFQGILIAPINSPKRNTLMSVHNEVAEALIEHLEKGYNRIEIGNHYTFPDIRPFKWHGWATDIRYTYVVDLSDNDGLWQELEKDTRYEINHGFKKSPILVYGDMTHLDEFDALYQYTFQHKDIERHGTKDLLRRIFTEVGAEMLLCYAQKQLTAATGVMRDTKRAYYILGASNATKMSYYALWETFKSLMARGVKEIDLVGCNDRNIALFKKGFAGQLKAYYKCSK